MRILQTQGIRPGDRVLVFIPTGIDLYQTLLAIFHCGAVAVFVEQWAHRRQLSQCLAIANCRAVVSTRKLLLLGSLLSKPIRAIPLKINIRSVASGWPAVKNQPGFGFPKDTVLPASEMVCQRHSDDGAMVTFTSGSTGTPKAANRTHGFLQAQLNALIPCIYEKEISLENLQTTEQERDMTLLPIVLLINLAIGRTSVLADFNPRKPQTFRASSVIGQIKKQQVSSLTASPYYIEQIAKHADESLTKQVKRIFCGGAAIVPIAAARMRKALPETEFHFIYGSTEAEPIAHITACELLYAHPDLLLEKGLCVGLPDDNIEVAIVSLTGNLPNEPSPADFDKAKCLAGGVGEICVRGRHVLQQYLNHAQVARENKYQTGNGMVWHRTGDAGYLDGNGFLYLAGRCKEIVRWQENDYFPVTFENNLQHWLPGAQGTLLSVDSQPVIVIATAEPENADALKDRLPAAWKITFIKELPKDKRHFSRIDYGKLRSKIRKKQSGF